MVRLFTVIVLSVLLLVSFSPSPLIAQSDNCSVKNVLLSFTTAHTTNSIDNWLERYANSECERQVLNGVRILASGYSQLSSIELGTVDNSCSKNDVIMSFSAAALSNSVDQWFYTYRTNCEGLTTAAGTLAQGYRALQLRFRDEILVGIGSGAEHELYIMNADGTNIRRITNNRYEEAFARWSPDGTKIVFQSSADNGNWDIYLLNTDGTNLDRLTTNRGVDRVPDWSPDGTKIVFRRERDGNSEIYIMNADGSQQQRITHSQAQEHYPRWSPDGTKIMFFSDRDNDWEIYVMDTDGNNVRQLTRNNIVFDGFADWSPDGAQIAFVTRRDSLSDEIGDIYVMDDNGRNQRRLTNTDAQYFYPIWSPDGTHIAFTSNRFSSSDNVYYLYTMNINEAFRRGGQLLQVNVVYDWQ